MLALLVSECEYRSCNSGVGFYLFVYVPCIYFWLCGKEV